jgi:hypothetical protein
MRDSPMGRGVIDRPHSLWWRTAGALYERPQSILCAKPIEFGYICQLDTTRLLAFALLSDVTVLQQLAHRLSKTNSKMLSVKKEWIQGRWESRPLLLRVSKRRKSVSVVNLLATLTKTDAG